jgi:uncharacterized membrane protein
MIRLTIIRALPGSGVDVMADAASFHPRALSDGYRAGRALLVGTSGTMLLLGRLPINEAVALGFLGAMAVDLLLVARAATSMTAEVTRQVFANWRANRRRMVERTVVITFMSIGILSLCVHDVHETSVLPPGVRILNYFAALFAAWLELHIGFAIYYAKHYFMLNPRPAADGPNPQGFVFTGTDEPVFTDFLYVAFAVGLTYAMSDVNLEDHRMRRVVLLHSITSFLFYSTVISAALNLMSSA